MNHYGGFSLFIHHGINVWMGPFSHADKAGDKSGLTMALVTWVTSTSTKWQVVQFKQSEEINILNKESCFVVFHLSNFLSTNSQLFSCLRRDD